MQSLFDPPIVLFRDCLVTMLSWDIAQLGSFLFGSFAYQLCPVKTVVWSGSLIIMCGKFAVESETIWLS